MKSFWIFCLLCLLAACAAPAVPAAAPTLAAPQATRPAPVARASVTPYPTPTRAPTITPEPSQTPAAIASPDPNSRYTIAGLMARQYGGGQATDLGAVDQNGGFVRHMFQYPSDGLKIHGFVNIPYGSGRFPIIIVLHGDEDPATYNSLDYLTPAADSLVTQGYFVIHPDLRNFPPSDNGDILYRAGYAVDVLNLIGLIKQTAGQPGSLFEHADPTRIGLWSHSMGGDIALRVAVISRDVRAVVLYSSLSGDERKNSQLLDALNSTDSTKRELAADPQLFAAISPASYYKFIRAAIQIDHGSADSVVPLGWAQETCQALKDAGVTVECFTYDGADHTFRSRYLDQFGKNQEKFLNTYLKK